MGDAEIIRMASMPLSSGMTRRKAQAGSIHTKEMDYNTQRYSCDYGAVSQRNCHQKKRDRRTV